MNKKRGLFCVVLVINLLLLTISVYGAATTEVLVDGIDDCDRRLGNFRPLEQYIAEGPHQGPNAIVSTTCGLEYTTAMTLANIDGCALGFYEYDGIADDCGLARVSPGFMMENKFNTITVPEENLCKWEATEGLLETPPDEDGAGFQCGGINDDDVYGCFKQQLAAAGTNSYFCNTDNLWYQCDSTAANNQEHIQLGTDLYYCVNNGGNYDWILGSQLGNDNDHDGVPSTAGDCNDNDITVYGDFGCIRVNGVEDCSNGKKAKVVCGDGKDNTCLSIPNEDDECDTNQVACTDPLSPLGQKSWLEIEGNNALPGNNNCCGDDGLNDLGATAIDSTGRKMICLNTQYAGEESGFTGWNEIQNSEWFWASAQKHNFKIITIKKPTEQPYDLVSDSEKWVACNANIQGPLESQALPAGQRNIANQFYCYRDGSQWSFAQCLPEFPLPAQQDNGIKERTVGDGLFSITPDSDPGDASQTTDTGSPVVSIIFGLNQYAGAESRQDIAPYNQLEFSARFIGNIFSPAEIQVTLRGLDQILFQKNVLASAVNTPVIEAQQDGFLHFKIPLPRNLKGVETVEIESVPEGNNIIVRNIFFSLQSSGSLLCSGQTSGTQSSWIEGADYFISSGNLINGRLVCAEIYGSKAWVGDNPAARCCGNNKNEYYVATDYTSNQDSSSCWNSKPIAAGDAVTTVEFEVEYTNAQKVVTYPSISFNYLDILSGSSQTQNDILDYTQGRKKLAEYSINKNDYSAEELETLFYRPTLLSTAQPVRVYYYDPVSLQEYDLLIVKDLPAMVTTIYTMAEFTKNYAVEVSTSIAEPSPRERMKYTCMENQCLYPLPGSPPYKITNLHPGLYKIYVVDNNNPNGILVTQQNQEFLSAGNILVKNIPLQAIFDNGLDNSGAYQGQPGFYGCEAADYVGLGVQGFTNENHCSIRENNFCAYSTAGTINGWSDEPITSTLEVKANEILALEARNYPPEERTNPTSILSGRNLLANSEFAENSGASVIGWEIVDVVAAGQQPLTEVGYVRQYQPSGKLTLQRSDTLRSEPIAVEENMNLRFTQDAACNSVKGYLVDKNGNIEEILPFILAQLAPASRTSNPTVNPSQQYLTGFNTGNGAYFYIEFSGGIVGLTTGGQQSQCDIKNPFLQRVDVQPVEFLLEGDQDKPRAGAACCPEGYCWNGYSCVAPMDEFTEISEQVGEEHYRCIDGSWQKQDKKYDWLGDKSGFCGAVSQCFVLSSQSGAIPGTTFDQVYSGNFPTCINSGEYVFDNFCEDGDWTSRTKVLAQELLNIVGTNDHSLYCGGYEDVLLNIQGVEPLLSGSGQRVTGIGSTETVCFEAISGTQGIRLVPAEKNKCINNACVVVDDNGNIIFATTLNKNPHDNLNSFLEIFGVPSQDLAQSCRGNFVNCNIGLSDGVIYYNSSLNAIIYSKQPLSLRPGVVTRFLTFLRNLFRNQSLLTLEDLGIKNFQEIYSLQKGSKKVLAVKGIFNEEPALIALYKNFDTPICDYLTRSQINNPEFNAPLQAQPLSCVVTSEGFKQVNATKGLDFLWPELTGKLRTATE